MTIDAGDAPIMSAIVSRIWITVSFVTLSQSVTVIRDEAIDCPVCGPLCHVYTT